MYRINDRSAAIKQVQKHLRALEGNENLVINGVFDERTRSAIKDFQRKSLIKESGIIDNITFTALYQMYLIKEKERRITKIAGISFPVYEGYYGNEMHVINRNLRLLLDYYDADHHVREGVFFGRNTGDGVEALRRIFMMPNGRYIDAPMYERMIDDLSSINKGVLSD